MDKGEQDTQEFIGKIDVKTEGYEIPQFRARRIYMGTMAWVTPILKVRQMICNKCHEIIDFEVTNGDEVRISKPDVEMVCGECGHKDDWWGMRVMENGGACEGVIFVGGERVL